MKIDLNHMNNTITSNNLPPLCDTEEHNYVKALTINQPFRSDVGTDAGRRPE